MNSQTPEAATVYQSAKQKLHMLLSNEQAPGKTTEYTVRQEEDNEGSDEVTATEIQWFPYLKVNIPDLKLFKPKLVTVDIQSMLIEVAQTISESINNRRGIYQIPLDLAMNSPDSEVLKVFNLLEIIQELTYLVQQITVMSKSKGNYSRRIKKHYVPVIGEWRALRTEYERKQNSRDAADVQKKETLMKNVMKLAPQGFLSTDIIRF